MKCQELVDMDSKFGRELQFLNDHYVKTHLRITGKPKDKDKITLDFFISCLTKLYGKNSQSCLVEELIKKAMASEGKFAKISVFISTVEEKNDAKLRRLQQFSSLQSSIGTNTAKVALDNYAQLDILSPKSSITLAGSNEHPLERKKTVQFSLPRNK